MDNNENLESNEDFDKLEKMIKEEEKKSPSKRVLICPVCHSTDVVYYVGTETGYQYRCKDCGYIGPFVLEK